MWQTLPPTIAGLRLKVLEDNLKSNILNIPQLTDGMKHKCINQKYTFLIQSNKIQISYNFLQSHVFKTKMENIIPLWQKQ